MSLPTGGSSVLDRVKMFLPLMAQANNELQQKIDREGQQSVQIDSHLSASAEPVADKNQMAMEESDEEEQEEEENAADHVESDQPAQKVVELNFALGDFDDTNIALMEEEAKKDEEEKEEGGEEDEEEEA